MGTAGLVLPRSLYGGNTIRRKPNILFLLADDQRADTIGAYGNHHIQTPNLDRPVVVVPEMMLTALIALG